MLRLLNLEALEALLLKVPALVAKFEDRDPGFVPEVKAWLVAAEQSLGQNRLATAAEVAACRGELIAAERGFANGPTPPTRSSPRRAREGQGVKSLKRATEIVSQAVTARRAQVDEAERITLQMVAIGFRMGLIQPESGQDHTTYLRSTMQALANQAELAALAVRVVGVLGNTDSLVILDRCIGQYLAA